MSGGFFSLPRGWRDNACHGAPEPFTRREAFAWLVEEAAWKDRRVATLGGTIGLHRGQLSHSGRFLAKAWGWDHGKVRRHLKRLVTANVIRLDTDSDQYVITICKYDEITNRKQNNDSGSTHDRRRDDSNKNTEIKEKDKNQRTRARQAAAQPRAPLVTDLREGGEHIVQTQSGEHAQSEYSSPQKALQIEGLAIIEALTDKTGRAAKGLLGSLRRLAKEDCIGLLEVLRQVQRLRPADPESYLYRCAANLGMPPPMTDRMSARASRASRLEGYFTPRESANHECPFTIEGEPVIDYKAEPETNRD